MVKNLPVNAGDLRDVGSIPGLGRSAGERHGNPIWYSCLENSTDKGVWRATVHRVAKSWTRLKRLSTHACTSFVIGFQTWASPALQVDSSLSEPPGKHCVWLYYNLIYLMILSCLLFYICCCCKVASVVSDSVWPHRWQPTKLLCPWDSPGKNTGVGCHFLLQCMHAY